MNKLFRLWESEEYAVCSLSPRNPQRDAQSGHAVERKRSGVNEHSPQGGCKRYKACADVFHVKHTLRLFCGGGRIGVRRVHCVLDGGLGVLQLLLQGFVFLFHLLQFLFQFFQFLL